MAQGSIIWRCRKCGNKKSAVCHHPRAGYSIVYQIGVLQKWEAVGPNKKLAERRLTQVLADLHHGQITSPKPVSFKSFAEQWLHDYAERRLKPSTLQLYRIFIRVHLNPAFGSLFLTQITPQHIECFLADCRREKGLAPKSVNSLLLLLKVMLKCAREWRILRDNPAETIKPARVEPKEMAFLRPDEVRLLWKNADEPYRTLFLAAVLTGMRRGELLGLQWGDIDWNSGVIHVKRTLYRIEGRDAFGLVENPKERWGFSSPKSSKSIRNIHMSPRLREDLELHRLQCPASPYDLVFCTKRGKPLHAGNMVRREFFPALSRAGLPRIRFHDLRHTYTTLLIAQGENVKLIQAQLGHASIQTTLDRYGHLLPDTEREIGNRLDAQLFPEGANSRAKVVLRKQAPPTINTDNQQQDKLPTNPASFSVTLTQNNG